jgi:polyisoprenoid-binding protein YceI
MKTTLSLSLFLALTFLLASFTTTTTPNTKEYLVNTTESKIFWVGSKMLGSSHNGYVLIKEGKLQVKDNKLTGGSFVIDINTITAIDMNEKNNRKLEGHLKNDDFFGITAFPVAEFTITEVEEVANIENANHNITGILTMRGVSKKITFPANVTISEDGVEATTPKFSINRMLWGVEYSGMKDNMIKNDVKLNINLTTK